MSYAVGHRCIWDPELLWLWCRLAVVAPIRHLAWELPYAAGVALKTQKKKKKKISLSKFEATEGEASRTPHLQRP